LGNIVRMVLLALGSLWFGSEFAIGRNIDGNQEMSFYHSMAGFAVFGVAMAGMFAICTQLERRLDKRPVAKPDDAEPALARQTNSWFFLAAVIGILGGGLAFCAFTDASYQVDPAGIKPDMPNVLGGYVSNEQPMTAREQSMLNEDVRIERRLYTKPDRVVLATVVLSGAEKRSLHPPDVCLPAQGWLIARATPIEVDLGGGRLVTATLMNMYRDVEAENGQRSRIRAFNIFWYLGSDGATCAGYQEHLVRTYSDAFFKNINHRWALLTFFVPIKNSPGGFDDPFAEISALEEAKDFIKSLIPPMLVK
jgi:hypothetical protein